MTKKAPVFLRDATGLVRDGSCPALLATSAMLLAVGNQGFDTVANMDTLQNGYVFNGQSFSRGNEKCP